MVKKIKGDLILTKDTTFSESIEVEGNIICEKERYDLRVAGNINAWNIDAKNINAWNIDAWNINAWNIDAKDIDAWNIDAKDIDAWNINARNIIAWNIIAWNIIFCEIMKLKDKAKGKIKAKVVIRKRSELEHKEFESD